MSFHQNKELRSRFTLKSPFDDLHFYNGHLFCFELKHTKYKSISIQRTPNDSDGMIHAHQINSLINLSQYKGVHAGFIFNFRDEEAVEEYTYYMSIDNFSNFLVESEKKSINKMDIVQHGGIIVESRKIRTLFDYNVEKLLEDIIKAEGKESESDGL